MELLKILIADDHELIRQGLRQTLQSGALEAEVLEARNPDETLAMISAHPELDLVLLDLKMPGIRNYELVDQISTDFPGLPLVILSSSESPADMRHCIDRGAAGFIPKSAGADVMLRAISLVLAGGIYIPPELLGEDSGFVDAQSAADSRLEVPDCLTQRQIDVLRLLADGFSNKRIARELGLSENTVKIHVTAILRALQLDNRTQAGVVAQKMGLTSQAE